MLEVCAGCWILDTLSGSRVGATNRKFATEEIGLDGTFNITQF